MATHLHDEGSSLIASTPLSDRSELRFRCTVAALTIAGLLLRCYRLGDFELWLDEAYTFRQMVIVDWLSGYLADNSPPLYNLLMRAWGRLAGYSEVALRAPSVACGTLFVATAALTAREYFDRRVGLWCAALAAFSPIHLHYSQEGRNYSLLLLLIMFSWLMLGRALKSMARRDWGLTFAGIALALLTHYFAVLSLLPMVLLVWLWPERVTRWLRLRRFLLLWLIALVPLLTWIVWSFVVSPHSFSGLNWMADIWERQPAYMFIPLTLQAFVTNASPQELLAVWGGQLPGSGWRLLIPLLTAALLAWLMRRHGDLALGLPFLPQLKWGFFVAMLLPLAILLASSFVTPIYIVGRYDLIAFPPFLLLAALTLSKMQVQGRNGQLATIFIGCCWLLAAGTYVYRFATSEAVAYHRATAQFLSQEVSNGDVVVFTGNRSFVTRYYLAQNGYQCRKRRCSNTQTGKYFMFRQYPTANEDEEAVYDNREILAQPDKAWEEMEEFLDMRENRKATLWLVAKGRWNGRLFEVRYKPDVILLDQLSFSTVNQRVASYPLFIIACTTPDRGGGFPALSRQPR